MHCVTKINSSITYIGYSDRRIALFENIFPLNNGVSYNSYFIDDEKTVLLDTVDQSVASIFFENLEYVLQGKKLDYVIINHMEPDHAATLNDLIIRYPNVKVITNAKAIKIIEQFFNFDIKSRAVVVNDGDTFSSGKHNFTFIMAPMVHWPEAMVTYDSTDKVLFSADAFGSFGALNGNIFADQVNYDRDWLDESRRYYTNIVGKYGVQVQALLQKASQLEIKMLCPLHGHVWRENLGYILDKYNIWSSYQPESKSVAIIYGSIYGNTENAANILANKLAEKGINNIVMYDVSKTHPSYIVSECFRCSHLVFASSTYNGGIYTNMETVLLDLKAHFLQNRTVAIIENGTWGAIAGKKIKEIFESMKNITIIEESAKISSSVKESNIEQLSAIADKISEDF